MNRHVPTASPPVLRRLGLREDQWHTQATGIERRYWRAVGAVDALDEKARTPGIAIVSPVVSLE